MNSFAIIFIVSISTFIGSISCSNAESLSAADTQIIKQHITLCKQQSVLNKLLASSYNNSMELLNTCGDVTRLIKWGNPAKIGYKIKDLKRKLNNAKKWLRNSEKYYKTLKLQYAEIIIDKAKTAELDKLEQTKTNLEAKIDKLKQPYYIQRQKLLDDIDINKKNQEFKQLFSQFFNISPNNQYININKKRIKVNYATATAYCIWLIDNQHIARARIKIRPINNKLNSKLKIAKKYSFRSPRENYIWFRVKNFTISFWVKDKSLLANKKITQLVEIFFNLQELEKASNNQLVHDSLSLYDSISLIKTSQNMATNKLGQELYKLNCKIIYSKRADYSSSKSMTQLKLALDYAENSFNIKKKIVAVSEQLIKILQSPSSDQKAHTVILENRINELKNEIISACKEARETKSNLTKEFDFNLLNKKYQILVNKFIRLPQSSEFELINHISTSAWLGIPEIACAWTTVYSSKKVFTGKINFDPGQYLKYSSAAGYDMIDDKYFIYRLNNYSIKVQAGDFTVSLTSKIKDFYKKKQLKKAVKELYDLDAIASCIKNSGDRSLK